VKRPVSNRGAGHGLGDPSPRPLATRRPAPSAGGPELPERVRSALTPHGYLSAWRAFQRYCAEAAVVSLPATPDVILGYVERRIDEGCAIGTLETIVAAILRAHEGAEISRPEMTAVRARLRERYLIPDHPSITEEQLRMLLRSRGEDALGRRDRALFLSIHHARLGPRDVVALNVEDLADRADLASLRRPHWDPHLCPVIALEEWLQARGRPEQGPVFVSVHPRHRQPWGARLRPHYVNLALANAVAAAGIPEVKPLALRGPRVVDKSEFSFRAREALLVAQVGPTAPASSGGPS
jgi:hypothetical protein